MGKKHIGILGGGISGVTLQRFLDPALYDSTILEAGPTLGGLCRTVITPGGFRYDIGAHIHFTKHEHVNQLVVDILGDNARKRRRDSRISYKGKLVKYPFANGFGVLDKEEVYECLVGYLDRPMSSNVPTIKKDLKNWFYETYGRGISEKNLIPYTEKIWKMPCDRLSCEFVDRIPPPPLDDMVRTALGISTEGYKEQLEFVYPEEGGFEAIVKAMSDHDHERSYVNFRISDIQWQRDGSWYVIDKHKPDMIRFNKIVSTLPLHDVVLKYLKSNIPDSVIRAVNDLAYNSLIVVFVAFDREIHLTCNIIYVADPKILFHRLCPTHVFSPSMVQPGTSGFAAEITCRPGDGIYEMSDDKIAGRVICDIHGLGLVDNRSNVVETHVTRARYAYPVANLHYRENVTVVRDYFAEIGVPLLGRSAEFDYINSDECIHRAIKLARWMNEEAGET